MTVPDNTAILGVSVPIADIEKELRLLWEVDEARTNASLMNFAVYSEKKGSLANNSEMVREITREHACRALLIGMDRHLDETSVRAWITAHCHLAHGQKSVCCEQIAFHLTGHSRGRFRNTIFAHLQSDLPLVFWWQGELSSIFTDSLYRRIDRLVLNSSDWADVKGSFETVRKAMTDVDLVVQDLAWTRTFHYRLAVASLYDDPVAQESIQATKRIRIEAHVDHKNSALQMLAWFTELAGWKRAQDLIAEENSKHTSYRFSKANGELVDVELSYQTDCAPLARFEVVSDSVKVIISRDLGCQQLRHQLSCENHELDVHGPADSDKCSELVADQLSRGGKNSLFRRVLPHFIDLLD